MKCEKCSYDDNDTGDFAHHCSPLNAKGTKMNKQILRIFHFYSDGTYEEIPVVRTQFIPGSWAPPVMPSAPQTPQKSRYMTKCTTCNIELSGGMGYVCGNLNCPYPGRITC